MLQGSFQPFPPLAWFHKISLLPPQNLQDLLLQDQPTAFQNLQNLLPQNQPTASPKLTRPAPTKPAYRLPKTYTACSRKPAYRLPKINRTCFYKTSLQPSKTYSACSNKSSLHTASHKISLPPPHNNHASSPQDVPTACPQSPRTALIVRAAPWD